MNIYIVRHGQTDWNKKGIIQGSTNIPLNDTGIQQAYQTKQQLDDVVFDCIFCSPLERAVQTAKIINEEHRVPMIIDERLIERNFGLLEGKNIKEVDFKLLWNCEILHSSYEEEHASTFFNRVTAFINDIITKEYSNILIVAHGGVSLPVYGYFKELSGHQDAVSYMLKNCEVACYETKKVEVL